MEKKVNMKNGLRGKEGKVREGRRRESVKIVSLKRKIMKGGMDGERKEVEEMVKSVRETRMEFDEGGKEGM